MPESDRLLAGLGRRVREQRTTRGLTLKELALRSGLSPRFLVQVESGVGNISVRNLSSLAKALGTTASTLLAEPAAPGRPPAITLLGLRGAGKTTVGRRLARRLRVDFVELDSYIERAAELTLAEIFALHGEDYYRRLERETLERLLREREGQSFVLATGGGVVASPATYDLLRRRTLTFWLKARPEDHWNRVVRQGDRRPMADHPQAMAELRRMLKAREPLYAQAMYTVETADLEADAVADAIADRVTSRAAGGGSRAPGEAAGRTR